MPIAFPRKIKTVRFALGTCEESGHKPKRDLTVWTRCGQTRVDTVAYQEKEAGRKITAANINPGPD